MNSDNRHNAHNHQYRGISPDADALFAVAEPRAGYFTIAQAESAGYSRSLLAHHAHSGMLERAGRGIYRLRRYPESPHADLIVAWLRGGAGAALSHESALELYGLTDVLPSEIHLTVRRTASRRRRGLKLHTSKLALDDVTTRDGITVTTVERTITDIARSGLSDELVLQAIREALERGLTNPTRLLETGGQKGGRTKRLIERGLKKSAR